MKNKNNFNIKDKVIIYFKDELKSITQLNLNGKSGIISEVKNNNIYIVKLEDNSKFIICGEDLIKCTDSSSIIKSEVTLKLDNKIAKRVESDNSITWSTNENVYTYKNNKWFNNNDLICGIPSFESVYKNLINEQI